MTTSTDHRQQEQATVVATMKPQVKTKQARRRTHASRPYQERLLNMAEARREIVTALKIHRASMRHHQPCTSSYHHQADTLLLRQPPLLQQQRQEQQQQQVQVVFHQDDQSQAVPPARTSYASFADDQLRNPLAHWIAAGAPAGSFYSSPVLTRDLTPLEAPMPTAMVSYGLGLGCHGLEQLARGLPAQPLGLNLSFQGFGGSVDGGRDCEDLYGVPVIQSASPAAASSYSVTETASGGMHGSPALSSTAERYSSPADAPAAAALIAPPVMDDLETEAQSAGGEVEWRKVAAVDDVAAASAWWSKILLESTENGGEVPEGGVESGSAVGCAAEDGVQVAAAAGLPAEWRWLCDDDGSGEQGAVWVTGADDKPPDVVLESTKLGDGGEYDYASCYGGVDGGIALPCMDGDDIEGWDDGEWFSCSS
ncbi:unnamed protein product [Urochloa humidicola]